MSRYLKERTIRLRISKEDAERIFGVDECGELDVETNAYFAYGVDGKFQIAPTKKTYIDYLLKHDYSALSSEYVKTRTLSINEFNKYVDVFRQILPDTYTINRDDLRLVECCWHNASYAPSYFDEETTHDSFL